MDTNERFLGHDFFILKYLGIIVSGMAIYLGYDLFILGVTGKASLSVELENTSMQLLNAAPSLFFAIGGLVNLGIVLWKPFRIKTE